MDPVTAYAVATAASTVISSLLAYGERGGDVTLEFDALNAKLDQVLTNQGLIFSAISFLDYKLTNVIKSIGTLPDILVATINLGDMQDICPKLADRIRDLDSGYTNSVEGLEELRHSLYNESISIMNNAKNSGAGAIQTASSCKRGLDALVLLDRQHYLSGESHRRELFDVCTYLQETLLTLTAENGIRSHLGDVRGEINTVVKLIGSSPLAMKVLPKEFFKLSETSKNYSSSPTVCLKSAESEKVTHREVHRGEVGTRPGNSDIPIMGIIGDTNIVLLTTHLTAAEFQVEGSSIVGGRPCYIVAATDPKKWKKSDWKRTERRQHYFDNRGPNKTIEISSDPKPKIAPCLAIPLDAEGLPKTYPEFLYRLAVYDALSAIESRILIIQSVALANLEVVKNLKEKLRA